MPNEDNKILKYKLVKESLKVPFVIHADLESLLKKYILVKIILKNLIQRKKLSICLQVTHGFASKNELDYYREKDCMEKFCKDLRENEIKVINHEKRK